MPRACSVCAHPQTAEITRVILGGGTNRQTGERYNLSHASIGRHRTNCLRASRKSKPPAQPLPQDSSPGTARFDSLEPKVLIAGTARLIGEALELLENAKRADDRRTALQALREARDGLALLMRAGGMLQGDGATLVIDNRKLNVALDARDLDELLGMRERLGSIDATAEPLAIEGEAC